MTHNLLIHTHLSLFAGPYFAVSQIRRVAPRINIKTEPLTFPEHSRKFYKLRVEAASKFSENSNRPSSHTAWSARSWKRSSCIAMFQQRRKTPTRECEPVAKWHSESV